MAVTKEKKAEILQGLIEKFGKSKTVVFSDYRGLDVTSISDLRSKLRETGSECKVAKKTLIKLAAKDQDLGELADDVMEGPVAVTFSYEDELSGLKALFQFSKTNDNLKLLGGIVDGKVIGADEIIQLAKLPGKEELYAKLLGSLNAPISGAVGLLGNLLGSFVRVVNAYKDTLPAEGTEPVESAEEAVADEPAPAEGSESVEPAEPATEDAPKEEPAEEPVKEEAPAVEEKPAEETKDEEGEDAPAEDAPAPAETEAEESAEGGEEDKEEK